MPNEIEFHEQAIFDLETATTWYERHSQWAARQFVIEVMDALDIIQASPDRWPLALDKTRKFLLKRFPFAIIYIERLSVIQVIAVAHGRRNPGYWKDRL